MIDTLAIVGVGLVGGSVALAARARGAAKRIVGVVRPGETLPAGLVDVVVTSMSGEVLRADLVLVCTPVSVIGEQVRRLRDAGVLGVISDVGSTKAGIVRQVKDASRFVGGHPLAGSEKRGPEHASATLFDQRTTLLTPTAQTDVAALDRVTAFWTCLGSRVVTLDPDTHDRVLARTSHLPHLVAFALAGVMPAGACEYAGAGLRDTTRLAGSDPALWADIAVNNREHLVSALGAVQDRLGSLQRALVDCDQERLQQLLQEGRKARHALGD